MFQKIQEILCVENVKKVVHGMYLNKLKIIVFRGESVEILQKYISQAIGYFLSKFSLKICYDLSLCENNILKKIPENSFLPVQQLQSELRRMLHPYRLRSALSWMENRDDPPTVGEQTRLDSGVRVGGFWHNCKSRQKCTKAPYDRLLSNPVLRADYR